MAFHWRAVDSPLIVVFLTFANSLDQVEALHFGGLYRGFRDTGYLPVYFQGYRILSILLPGIWDTGSIFSLLPGILKI